MYVFYLLQESPRIVNIIHKFPNPLASGSWQLGNLIT